MTAKKHHRLTARKPENYDPQRDDASGSNVPPGDRTINPNMISLVNVVRPRYKEGPLYCRAFPYPDPENPTAMLLPGRKSAEPNAYTPWRCRVPSLVYFGAPGCTKVTFILGNPHTWADDKMNNPGFVLAMACKKAAESGTFGVGREWRGSWNPLMKGKTGEGAPISMPKPVFFVQGCVYANGDKNYMTGDRTKPFGLAADDNLVVMQLSGSVGQSGGTGEKLTELLNQRKDEYEGDEDVNPNVGFKWGDPVGRFLPNKRVIRGGVIMEIFNPKRTKVTFDKDDNHTSWDGKIGDFQGYEVALYKEITLNGATYTCHLESDDVDSIFSKVQFWFDDPDTKSAGLLYIPPIEEQALWLAQSLKVVPELVSWAWSEHPEFMTDEVRGVLLSRASAAVPAASGDEDYSDEPAAPTGRKVRKDPTAPPPSEDEEDEFAASTTEAADDENDAEAGEETGEAEVDDVDDVVVDAGTDEFEDDPTAGGEEAEASSEEADTEAEVDDGVVTDDDEQDAPAPVASKPTTVTRPQPAAGKTTAAKPATKSAAAQTGKPVAKLAAKSSLEDDVDFGDEDTPTGKSMKTVQQAKDNSGKRGQTPTKPAPAKPAAAKPAVATKAKPVAGKPPAGKVSRPSGK